MEPRAGRAGPPRKSLAEVLRGCPRYAWAPLRISQSTLCACPSGHPSLNRTQPAPPRLAPSKPPAPCSCRRCSSGSRPRGASLTRRCGGRSTAGWGWWRWWAKLTWRRRCRRTQVGTTTAALVLVCMGITSYVLGNGRIEALSGQMCVYICVYICVCVCVCVCVRTGVHECVYASVYACLCVSQGNARGFAGRASAWQGAAWGGGD
jgi:hypothetical protein